METKPEHFLAPVLVILVGAALVYVGLWLGWGAVWAAAGAFFIVLGLGAEVLALAWRLPGPIGAFCGARSLCRCSCRDAGGGRCPGRPQPLRMRVRSTRL
jgi:hypothetical protein